MTSLRCTDVTDSALVLHYVSHRDGLAPMVVGLLHGLGHRCGVTVTVDHVARRADGADHDQFAVSWA